MPIIRDSTYSTNGLFKNSHVQSIYHKYFRPKIKVKFERERFILSDGDFIDLDWIKKENKRLVILLHGLEGSSNSNYIHGIAKLLSENNWNVCAMNFRGCSGELNHQFRAYHSGDYGDLEEVMNHSVKNYGFNSISIVGFSLGGNVALRYAGIKGLMIPPVIQKIVGISVPCDLKSSAYKLEEGFNKVYLNRFIQSMREKVARKRMRYPEELPKVKLKSLKTFKQFDDYYTAPAHGYSDAHTYWADCSSAKVIDHINVPTYIINALDDQFLTPECFPIEPARNNRNVLLELPEFGGHVGFVTKNKENVYWHEQKILEFLKD